MSFHLKISTTGGKSTRKDTWMVIGADSRSSTLDGTTTTTMSKAKAMSEEYKDALNGLTFNSKPMINMLTLLAGDNTEYAQPIVTVVCERIRTMATVDLKMPALYLLDSIMKNVGSDYLVVIAKYIIDVFCCVFEIADERSRLALFKLRNTWNEHIGSKILYELDLRVQSRLDPKWPVVAPPTSPSNVIHVNPKVIQNPAVLAAKIQEERQLEEEKKRQQQELLQKQQIQQQHQMQQLQLQQQQQQQQLQQQREHELQLQQNKLAQERKIAEQTRQLEVLRKQQDLASKSGSKKRDRPIQYSLI